MKYFYFLFTVGLSGGGGEGFIEGGIQTQMKADWCIVLWVVLNWSPFPINVGIVDEGVVWDTDDFAFV